MQINIDKYWIVKASDYCYFQDAQEHYAQAGIIVDYYELDYDLESQYYTAIFWVGTQTKEVKQFIEEWEEKLKRQQEEEEEGSNLRTVTIDGVRYIEIKE